MASQSTPIRRSSQITPDSRETPLIASTDHPSDHVPTSGLNDPDSITTAQEVGSSRLVDGADEVPVRSSSGSRSASRRATFDDRWQGQAEPISSHRNGWSSRSQRPAVYRDYWDYEPGQHWRDEVPAPRNSDRYWTGEYPADRFTRRSYRPPRSYYNRRPMPPTDRDMDDGPWDDRTSMDPSDNRQRRILDEEHGSPPSRSGFQDPKIGWENMTRREKSQVMRLPLTDWMNSSFKNHFVASLGEFVGTTMFLFFAFAGTEVANIGSDADNDSNTTTGEATGFNAATLLYISLSFGFSLMVNAWIFFRISGGLFNPAVTLGMVLVKAITIARGVCLFISQMAGAMLASTIVRWLLPESFNVRTTLGGGASLVQGVLIECILTAELVFTIFMLAKEKHRATFMAPIGIGLALFISELVGVQFTGGSLNPARSFGPCVITRQFDAEHWIYWVGPLSGSTIAALFYRFIKTLEYEMANPGADGDDANDPTKNPEKLAEIQETKPASLRV